MEIKILFEAVVPKQVKVHLKAPTNGKIKVTHGLEETEVTDGMQLPVGTEVKITATANENYEFKKFDVDGVEKTENPYKFNLTEETTIGADFTLEA